MVNTCAKNQRNWGGGGGGSCISGVSVLQKVTLESFLLFISIEEDRQK